MGITNKILEDNKSLIPEAPKPKGAADDQVLVVMQLRHVWTPMVILVAGLIISTCVFVFLETGTKKNSNK